MFKVKTTMREKYCEPHPFLFLESTERHHWQPQPSMPQAHGPIPYNRYDMPTTCDNVGGDWMGGDAPSFLKIRGLTPTECSADWLRNEAEWCMDEQTNELRLVANTAPTHAIRMQPGRPKPCAVPYSLTLPLVPSWSENVTEVSHHMHE